MRRIPVLAYHSWRFEREEYAHNDHIALREDLRLMDAMGVQVVSLKTALREAIRPTMTAPLAAVTFDDGAKYDVQGYGPESGEGVTGFLPILRAHARRRRLLRRTQPTLHATAFVIASAAAHAQMNAGLDAEFAWIAADAWSDDWWREADRERLLSLGNHSWDHNHPNVDTAIDAPSGDFLCVDTFERAEREIGDAQRTLQHRYRLEVPYFAYPWGQCPDYLRMDYLPKFGAALGIQAAFTTDPEYLTATTDRWAVPRFVCGDHFKSSEELRAILQGAR